MEKNVFILKEGANPNYLCTICKIGETFPIEGADKIQKTVVNGYDMVISKTMKTGDVVVYFPVETAICEKYLSANNLYEIGEWEKNANAPEVGILMHKAETLRNECKFDDAEATMAIAKGMVGFFNKRGRVRILKLRGCSSQGFIAGVDSLVNFDNTLEGCNWEDLIGTQFNYIGETEFCWKYIPPVKEASERDRQHNYKKRLKKVNKFDRIIPGTFLPHYDTVKVNDVFSKVFTPDDMVTISVKVHGTSIILANIPVNRKLTVWEKIKRFFGANVSTTEYGNVYSSRSVIKNQYINPNAQSFYESDIWGCVNRDFSPYINKDMTIYGEVAGYLEGSNKMIQKDHDYGCKVGQWKFMPYRIVTKTKDGADYEWNVNEVYEWTMKLISEHPELTDKVLPIKIVYHGRFGDLYPDINREQHWHENVLARMKVDTANFGMELKEPMCHLYEAEANAAKAVLDKAIENGESKKIISKLQKEYEKWELMRAPREGIVIRIDNDPKAEAWKLKCQSHYDREAAQHDAEEADIEELA